MKTKGHERLKHFFAGLRSKSDRGVVRKGDGNRSASVDAVVVAAA